MRSNWVSLVVISTVLALGTIGAYFTVVWCNFVFFDDPEYVFENPYVLRGLSWDGWSYAWTSTNMANWHPLTWLSFEFDGTFWGANPIGYHCTNLLIHAANVVLLFLVLFQMTQRLTPSACVAALFAVHPMHVESVAWISERKDVLSTFFLLLTLMAYVRFVLKPSVVRYLPVAILLTLGLLAKPMLVTLPILLILLDVWPFQRIDWHGFDWHGEVRSETRYPRRPLRIILLEKLPLLVIALIDGLTTLITQDSALHSLSDSPFAVRFTHTFYAYSWYLMTTIYPSGLTIFYPHPERNLSWLQVLFGICLVSLISAYAVWTRKSRPHVIVGWLWFVISLLPVIGLIQVGAHAFADRYVYVPHIGLFVMIVWEACDVLAQKQRVWRIASTMGFCSLILTFGVMTHRQISIWENEETLWKHALKVVPENWLAHFHIAYLCFHRSDYEGTVEHTLAAIRLRPYGHVLHRCYLGRSLVALNRVPEAEKQFLDALKIDPRHECILDELVKLYRKQNRSQELAQVSSQLTQVLRRRVKQKPDDVPTRLRFGLLLARQGEFVDAIFQFQEVVKQAPESASAHHNLGLALIQVGRLDQAKPNLLRAIKLNPNLANAHFSLAEILEQEGDLNGAKSHFSESLRLNPDDSESRQRLKRLSSG